MLLNGPMVNEVDPNTAYLVPSPTSNTRTAHSGRQSAEILSINAYLPEAHARTQSTRHPMQAVQALKSKTAALSPWSRSTAKRCFDCVCVLLALPLVTPFYLLLALMVRLSSSGPVLFVQERVGQHGKIFRILKFRTMQCVTGSKHHAVTTAGNQRFTPVGPFLRRFKLDELPQLVNVLIGDMSLVGPRPKLPEHVQHDLPCRPGITGAATLAFACEETILTMVPKDQLDAFFHQVVLPAKSQLDAEYMSGATFWSDFRLIVKSVLRRWNDTYAVHLLISELLPHADQLNTRQSIIPASSYARPVARSAAAHI